MIAGDTNDGQALPAGEDIRAAALHRSLAEVYLLLDNIASSNSKALPQTLETPLFAAGEAKGRDWLKQITEIGWPPEGSQQDIAEDTAKLIYAKDYLSRMTSPATTQSIAFTSLFVEHEASFLLIVRRLLSPAFWRELARRPAPEPCQPAAGWRDASLADLAQTAFPRLDRVARGQRWQRFALIGFLGTLLAGTILLAWDVTTGRALLSRVTTLEQKRQAAFETLPATAQPAAPGAQPPPATATPDKALAAYQRLNVQSCAAQTNLEVWLQRPIHAFPVADMPKTARQPEAACAATPAAAGDDTVNLEWAAILLSVLANAVLPVLYGVLGSTTAVVRSISGEIREWKLTPRSMRLAYFKLILGAVIGGMISLFLSPTGDEAHWLEKISEQIHISTAAVCFIAGYGVDSVFAFLDGLVSRVFALNVGPVGLLRQAPPPQGTGG